MKFPFETTLELKQGSLESTILASLLEQIFKMGKCQGYSGPFGVVHVELLTKWCILYATRPDTPKLGNCKIPDFEGDFVI